MDNYPGVPTPGGVVKISFLKIRLALGKIAQFSFTGYARSPTSNQEHGGNSGRNSLGKTQNSRHKHVCVCRWMDQTHIETPTRSLWFVVTWQWCPHYSALCAPTFQRAFVPISDIKFPKFRRIIRKAPLRNVDLCMLALIALFLKELTF